MKMLGDLWEVLQGVLLQPDHYRVGQLSSVPKWKRPLLLFLFIFNVHSYRSRRFLEKSRIFTELSDKKQLKQPVLWCSWPLRATRTSPAAPRLLWRRHRKTERCQMKTASTRRSCYSDGMLPATSETCNRLVFYRLRRSVYLGIRRVHLWFNYPSLRYWRRQTGQNISYQSLLADVLACYYN